MGDEDPKNFALRRFYAHQYHFSGSRQADAREGTDWRCSAEFWRWVAIGLVTNVLKTEAVNVFLQNEMQRAPNPRETREIKEVIYSEIIGAIDRLETGLPPMTPDWDKVN